MTEGSSLLQTLGPELKIADELEALCGKTPSGFCKSVGSSVLELPDWVFRAQSHRFFLDPLVFIRLTDNHDENKRHLTHGIMDLLKER